MTINQKTISSMLLTAAERMEQSAAALSEIDSRFGDGDHGITIGKIAKLLKERVPRWGGESIKEFLDQTGAAVMAVRGGSAGPLYGTMIGGLGALLEEDEAELDGEGVKRMLRGSLREMEDITPAKVGDKTMMDALIPAVEAAQAARGTPKEILLAAAAAGEAGARASEQFVSKFGRAKSYKDQTIGTPDAGAVSTSIFLRGLAEGA